MKLVYFLLAVSILSISACGGGGGGSSNAAPTPPPPTSNEPEVPDTSYQAGVYRPSEEFKNYCEAPRSGINPQTGAPYADVEGSVLTENHWLRSWSNELYLWYDEIEDQDPTNYDNPLAYFETLKSFELTPSGNPRDRFHFTAPTDEWLAQSQSGVSVGYGMSVTITNPFPPRETIVRYVEPGSPAEQAGIDRGTRILAIDGENAVNGSDIDTLNAGLAPSEAGEEHSFEVQRRGESGSVAITMTSANVESSPVLHSDVISAPAGTVGYLVFNSHIATAEEGLVEAFSEFSDAGVDELVLDLRYNGGGLLLMAAQVGFMVGGHPHTQDKVFELQSFNDKHPVINPIDGTVIEPIPFIDRTLGFNTLLPGQNLPALDLGRVVVLSSAATCSASESIINGLRGVGVKVILIGDTTCGKPYGFSPQDNCGTTYFTIQFRGENAAGFGDYADGFSPVNIAGSAGELLPGCAVTDDFSRVLGDPLEAQLGTALNYLETGADSCPSPDFFSQSNSPFSTFATASDAPAQSEALIAPSALTINDRILGMP